MREQADYSYVNDHIVILGWLELRTQRLVEEVLADSHLLGHEIVLCTTKEVEHPMTELLRFVHDTARSDTALHRRAGMVGAAVILALGYDDNDTLAAALAAVLLTQTAHRVAHFQPRSLGDLLRAHCPRTEVRVSLSIVVMASAALYLGSSNVHRERFSLLSGGNQYRLRVPTGTGTLCHGEGLGMLKQTCEATLIAMAANALGHGLQVNAPLNATVPPRGTALLHRRAAD